MITKSFNVHDCVVKLTTEDENFAQFVNANYKPFISKSVEKPDISVRFTKKAGENAREQKKQLQTIGEDIYFSKKRIFWENEYGFTGLVTLNDLGNNNQPNICVQAFHQEFLEEQSSEERYKNFQRSMRWTVHYPLFTLLMERHNWELLHAAAVTNGETTLVFAGLNKVGKSTLATYLCQNHGFRILTDNYLLVGDQSIYGFPEVIRLGSESMKLFELESLWDHEVYGKHHIDPTDIGTAMEATPDAFFILSRGNQLRTREIEPEDAWQSMENLHAMLGEFPQHNFMAVWPMMSDLLSEGRNNLSGSTQTALFLRNHGIF